MSLAGEYSNKSKIFDFIIISDKINLDYEMKMLVEFNYENVFNINEKLTKFYINAKQSILDIERLINENINTKS